jgi:hypothetical protein
MRHSVRSCSTRATAVPVMKLGDKFMTADEVFGTN